MTKNSAEMHYSSIDDFRIIFEQLISAQQEYSEDLPHLIQDILTGLNQ